MESELLKKISEVSWKVLKSGEKITVDYLKQKLSEWLIDDAIIERIKADLNKTPEPYLLTQEIFKAYLESNEDMRKTLEGLEKSNSGITQNIQGDNNGTNININRGIIERLILGSNFSFPAPEKCLYELKFVKEYYEKKDIRIVKSFSDNKEFAQKENADVYADVDIPDELIKDGCSDFWMVLFDFIPPKNFSTYTLEGYFINFELETSANIQAVQLEIKNASFNKIVDKIIDVKAQSTFSCKMNELATEDAWKDVKEICFTIFANPQYINYGKGYIKVKDFNLSK